MSTAASPWRRQRPGGTLWRRVAGCHLLDRHDDEEGDLFVKAIQPAKRMSQIPPYFFAKLGSQISELRAKGVDVIRIDIGSPDMPPAEPIIDKLIDGARRDDAHGYSTFGGPADFRQAVAAHYDRRFGVNLDAGEQVLGLVGSKEGLFNLTQAMVDPGDVVLVPDPGYPVYTSAARFAGADVVTMPLRAENEFLPSVDDIPASALDRRHRRSGLLRVHG
jgi:LL-diaminopimelate aminotransferase